ncbi:MAG: hypothetical protein JST81_05245 [Bacteroidetes bacterium]|jgi:hypothetical protein|nr:hypothetical protein [Bacteroidota bacterium]
MKKYLVIFCLLHSILISCSAQLRKTDLNKTNRIREKSGSTELPSRPSMAKVTFADGRTLYANVITQSASDIRIKLVNNDTYYTIDKKGMIKSSNGKYQTGSKVQSVLLKKAGNSIYNDINQSNFDYGILGFEFPDGKVQYAKANTINSSFLSITMTHSSFNYYLYYKNGEWSIDMQGGEYQNGTVIKDIFVLDQKFKRFY